MTNPTPAPEADVEGLIERHGVHPVIASALRTQAARIAELERERDEALNDAEAQSLSLLRNARSMRERTKAAEAARDRVRRMFRRNTKLRMDAERETARLRARLVEAARVIEPFAAEAVLWDGYSEDELLVEGWSGGPPSSLTVGHLRAARHYRQSEGE